MKLISQKSSGHDWISQLNKLINLRHGIIKSMRTYRFPCLKFQQKFSRINFIVLQSRDHFTLHSAFLLLPFAFAERNFCRTIQLNY